MKKSVGVVNKKVVPSRTFSDKFRIKYQPKIFLFGLNLEHHRSHKNGGGEIKFADGRSGVKVSVFLQIIL